MKTKRSDNLRFLYSGQVLIGALVVAVLLAVGFGRAYIKDYSSIQEIRELEAEAKRLEAEQISLLELLQYVQSDAYVEEEARTNLQYKEPNEEVIIFTNAPQERAGQVADTRSNLIKWWEYFFGG